MIEKWDILQVLRHSRHDWLNVVQLIGGNLSLKKYDRVEEIIQEVINKTQHESKLSNLGMPLFASEILVFNWENIHHFQIEFEVIGTTRSLERNEKSLLLWFHDFTDVLNQCCQHYGDNHLLLTIELLPEQLPHVTFDFHGMIIDEARIKNFIENENNWNDQLKRVESYISKEEFYLSLMLKE